MCIVSEFREVSTGSPLQRAVWCTKRKHSSRMHTAYFLIGGGAVWRKVLSGGRCCPGMVLSEVVLYQGKCCLEGGTVQGWCCLRWCYITGNAVWKCRGGAAWGGAVHVWCCSADAVWVWVLSGAVLSRRGGAAQRWCYPGSWCPWEVLSITGSDIITPTPHGQNDWLMLLKILSCPKLCLRVVKLGSN